MARRGPHFLKPSHVELVRRWIPGQARVLTFLINVFLINAPGVTLPLQRGSRQTNTSSHMSGFLIYRLPPLPPSSQTRWITKQIYGFSLMYMDIHRFGKGGGDDFSLIFI